MRATPSTGVDVTLSPLPDGRGSTSEDGSSTIVNGDWDVVEPGVVDQKGSTEPVPLCTRSLDEDRGVGNRRVDDEVGACALLCLRGTAGFDLEADLAVLDVDVLEGPSPVPVHVDGGLGVGNLQVADSESVGDPSVPMQKES